MNTEDVIMTSQLPGIDDLLDIALPQLASAAERGLLTSSQIQKLHSFVETVRNAPAYEYAYPPPVSLSRILRRPMSQQSGSFICCLPNEVIVEILCVLGVDDILSIRPTCKRLYSLTRLRYVWHWALHRHVVDKGLPVPSPTSISGLRYRVASSLDLEARAVHATRLHANFTSDNPQITRAVQLQTGSPPLDPEAEPLPQRLTSVKHIVFFDTSHGQQYIIAAFSMDCLGCWEISPDSGNIFHVAQWHSISTISCVLVNECAVTSHHDSSQGVIAVATEAIVGLKVTILALDKFRGHFVEMGTVMNPNSSSLHRFRGFLLAFAGDTRIIHWRDSFACRLQSDVWIQEGSNILCMSFIGSNFLLLIRPQSIELYPVPTVQVPLTHTSRHPIASSPLPFVAYEATVSGYYPQPHGAPMSVSGQTRRHPVSLLLRGQEAGFEFIHHYVLDLEPQQSDGIFPPRPVRFPPTLVRTIPVSPSCSNVSLSPSGRGYWLETRNVGSKRRSYPARCVVPLCITSMSSHDIAPDLPEEWQVDLKVGTSHLYERQCGLKDLKEGKQRVSAVAMDDSVGRIAIGDVDGGIVVLDYA